MLHNQSIPSKIYQEYYSIKLGDRNFALSTRMILIVILMVAVALRLISAFYQGNDISDLPGVYDQISYDGLARRVVDGHGFSFAEGHWPATRAGEPTAHWSYIYTLYLAVIYKVFGTYPLIARVIQALIGGIFQTYLVWRLGTRLFDQKVGLIAAGLNAVYVYFFYYAGALITETFYITCILWTFDASFRLVRDDAKMVRWHQWLELGLAIGLTVLLRQVFLLFLPFLFFWIWWNVRDGQDDESGWKNYLKHRIHGSAIKGLSVVVLILTLMIAPWTIRNYQAFGTFVLLNTNAGFAFYWGNHPIHGTKFIPIISRSTTSYQELIPQELLSLNEAEIDKALMREGFRIVLDDPVRYILLSVSRIEEYVKFWPSKDSNFLSNVSRVGSFGILLPFMIFGVGVSLSRFGASAYTGRRARLLLVYSFIVIYASIHFLTWTLIRYRLPIDAFLIIFAALSFETLIKKIYPATWMSKKEQK